MNFDNDSVFFGIQVPFARFTALAEAHARANPDTPSIEVRGKKLIADNFPEPEIEPFVRAVCRWGGYEGIAGRVLRRNRRAQICVALREAASRIAETTPNVRAALESVNRLKDLGTPSFASKHLRFLFPEHCPVFDSLLQEALPYSFDPEGYGCFARDCSALATELSRRKVANPWSRRNGLWFAADAEAVLYAHVTKTDEG